MSDDKKTWSLNPIENLCYDGIKFAFVGFFMVKDLFDSNKKD